MQSLEGVTAITLGSASQIDWRGVRVTSSIQYLQDALLDCEKNQNRTGMAELQRLCRVAEAGQARTWQICTSCP